MNHWKLEIRNWKLYFLVVVCYLSFGTSMVSAHVLESNGSVGAVMHITPDDDPVIGQPANFYFEFKDKQGKFSPQNCNCTFAVIEDGKQIYSEPLFQNNSDPSLTNASLTYTFPEKNVYQVKLTGQPNTTGAFQAFTLTYDIRVSREVTGQASTSQGVNNGNWLQTHLPIVIGGVLIGLILIFGLVKQFNKPKV